MELRTLRYFVYVAEARSFSNASIQLRIAQPALSRQISKLEAEIGHPLFLRTGRRLELTEPGQLLLSRAHALLRQASNALEEIRTFGFDLTGTVTIGVSPATCEIVAPIILEECGTRHPHLKIRFIEGFSSLVFEQLMNKEMTLCLLHNPPAHKAIDIHPLVVEAMYLVGPPPGARGLPAVSAGMELESLPMILPNKTHSLRLALAKALKSASQLNVAVQTDGVITTRALVAAGLGYTILPYSAIHNQLHNGQVSCLRLDRLSIPWTLCLACRTDQQSARPVQAILDIINSRMDVLTGNENVSSASPG